LLTEICPLARVGVGGRDRRSNLVSPMPYLLSIVGFNSTRTAGRRTAADDHLAHTFNLRERLAMTVDAASIICPLLSVDEVNDRMMMGSRTIHFPVVGIRRQVGREVASAALIAACTSPRRR
jgi:hypothetical protein